MIEFFSADNRAGFYTSPYLSHLSEKFRKEQKRVQIIGISNDSQNATRKYVEVGQKTHCNIVTTNYLLES